VDKPKEDMPLAVVEMWAWVEPEQVLEEEGQRDQTKLLLLMMMTMAPELERHIPTATVVVLRLAPWLVAEVAFEHIRRMDSTVARK
jgi:thiosulfate reductase cytochrome b subunit